MSKSLNISVLVAARDEYIEQIRCILCPLIIKGLNSIYSDALELSGGKKTLYKFQELLKEIPKWNQTILQEESKRIKKACPYIMDIVTAIFVSSVKILASVRLKGNNENIRVKIPTSDIFIHSIYIEAAQQIFYNPYLFYHKNSFGKVQENNLHVEKIIHYAVDKTIRQMLPLDHILQEYLANALNDNADNDSETESDESDVSDSDEDSLHGNDIIESDESDEEPEPEDQNVVKNFNMDNNGFIKPVPEPPIQVPHQFQVPEPQIQVPQPPVQMPQQQIPFEQLQSRSDFIKTEDDSDSDDSSDSDSSSDESEDREPVQQQQQQQPVQQYIENNNKHSFF
jgi:hypothetical protein